MKDQDIDKPQKQPRKLVYEFGRFVFLGEYEDHFVPKEAGFWWDRYRGAWVTTDARRASGLIMFADRECKKRILDKMYGPVRENDGTMFTPPKVGRYGS